jgi:hypothetical protein
METTTQTTTSQPVTQEIYNYAANLLIHGNKNAHEVKKAIMERGYDAATAESVVLELDQQIRKAKKDRAGKDILYGSLWCVGGTIATLANIGFIFWGAIVFGLIQLIKGIVNYNSN